jgi:DNA-binding transcriptional LysR family regulator
MRFATQPKPNTRTSKTPLFSGLCHGRLRYQTSEIGAVKAHFQSFISINSILRFGDVEEKQMRIAPSDIRGLRVFRAIVENSGFQGAQIELGMSQSALSFHLKALEERFGFELCRRGRAGLQMTERGRHVYEASKSLISAIAGFEGRLGELRGTVVGNLRVGIVSNTVTDDALPINAVIDACLENAPAADVQLLIAHPQALADELVSDGIDIALTPPVNIGPNFRETLFYHESHALYCSSKHPLFNVEADELTPATIASCDFVARSYARHAELSHWPGANVRIRVSTMEALAILVLSGRVIGFLPEHFAAEWERNGRLRRLSQPNQRYASPFVVVSKVAKRQSPLQKMFIRELRQRCSLTPG